MLDPQSSPLFEAWIHPNTGLEVLLLSAKSAPLQQSFYFVNDGMSRDGRYLWFYCAFPPSGSGSYGRTLAVLDNEAQTLRHFPETQFQHASPFVDPDSGEIYWTTGASIWRRGPQPDAAAECVNTLPADVTRRRGVTRLATHLSSPFRPPAQSGAIQSRGSGHGALRGGEPHGFDHGSADPDYQPSVDD